MNVYLARVETQIQRSHEDCSTQLTVNDLIAKLVRSALTLIARLENQCGQCTRTWSKAKGAQPVKILLAEISNFYGGYGYGLAGSVGIDAAFRLRGRIANHPSPAIRYAR